LIWKIRLPASGNNGGSEIATSGSGFTCKTDEKEFHLKGFRDKKRKEIKKTATS
jgi:hypothetical protein